MRKKQAALLVIFTLLITSGCSQQVPLDKPERLTLSGFHLPVTAKNINEINSSFTGYGTVMSIGNEEFILSADQLQGSEQGAIYFRTLSIDVENSSKAGLQEVNFAVLSDYEPRVNLEILNEGDRIYFAADQILSRITQKETYSFKYLAKINDSKKILSSLNIDDDSEIPTFILQDFK